MDIKRFFTTMLLTGVIMVGVFYFFPKFFGGGDKANTHPTTQYASTVVVSGSGSEQGATPETITLGSAEKGSKDKVSVTVSNVTAAIEHVKLNINNYAETISKSEPLTVVKAQPGLPRPFSTLGLHITMLPGGREVVLREPRAGESVRTVNAQILQETQYVWKVTKKTAYEAEMMLTAWDRGVPVAEVTKRFKVNPDSYEVLVSHHVKNLTTSPIKVEINQLGPTDLPRDNIQMDNRSYHGAHLNTTNKVVDATSTKHDLAHTQLSKLDKGTQSLGKFVGTDPMLWVASSNRFFTAIVRPLPRENPTFFVLEDKRTVPVVDHLAEGWVDVLKYDGDNPSATVSALRLEGARVEIAPGTGTTMPLAVFFGPKKRDVLEGRYTTPGPVSTSLADVEAYTYNVFNYMAVIRFSQGNPCGFCTFDWLAIAILKLLDFLVAYAAFGNYGVAIMILVIVVRLLLHPLTRMSQIQMAVMSKKMSAIQPELEASKKRYAKDPKKQQEEMMRIYRENNVNPAGGILGCLPMLIQMPIWMALYAGLAVDIDLRHASFIPGWINDLSNPDAVMSWTPINIPVISWLMGPIGSLNLLPILLGVVFYVQMKVMTASQPKATDPQQAQMQKISSWMIMIFPLFLYSAPSGLNLYIFASTIGGLFDTYLVRRTLRKRGILPATAGALTNNKTDE